MLLLPPLGSWLVSVALKCRMEHCLLLVPFPAFGVCCFLPGGARVAKAVRKLLQWEGEVGCSHASNGGNEAVLERVAKQSLCSEEVAFKHPLQRQET